MLGILGNSKGENVTESKGDSFDDIAEEKG